ncbi:MAG: ribonuclease P protein subunit [Thaumarchaeota archaeon]|nr:MAG: ribonuclease P protein subunit [Nitrososphaerota archaeon]
MSLIGRRVKILVATDPNQVGLSGELVLERSKTLLLESHGRRLTIQKLGTVIELAGTGRGEVIRGDDILGRVEERIARDAS